MTSHIPSREEELLHANTHVRALKASISSLEGNTAPHAAAVRARLNEQLQKWEQVVRINTANPTIMGTPLGQEMRLEARSMYARALVEQLVYGNIPLTECFAGLSQETKNEINDRLTIATAFNGCALEALKKLAEA